MQFAFILHAHLPHVRASGPQILEERWLYEAVAETYLPLIWSLERLQRDGVPARMAISLSAPLLAMLSDGEVMERCRAHLAHMQMLAERQAEHRVGTTLGPAAAYHARRLAEVTADLDRRGDRLAAAFRDLEAAGYLEAFTAAGTHGYLPLLATDAGRRAQIEAGLAEFEQHFGHKPRGIWLPECAYAPGLDHLLSASGVEWFIAESSTVAGAYPPVPGAPVVRTPGGVAAFARNLGVARQVWDSRIGYPGDPDYREFYRDEGYDLPLAEVAPWLVDGQIRSDTGLKLYRVTGDLPLHEKRPYIPQWAEQKVRAHARHFAALLRDQTGLVVAPFDAELFGHWWFEGPLWIEQLFRELATMQPFITPVTPSEYLGSHPEMPVAKLPAGSWGVAGDHRIWLAPVNDYLWPRLHAAEIEMVGLARDPESDDEMLDRAARELLLAQASDWPFILSGGTTVEYARRRAEEHLGHFRALTGTGVGSEPAPADDLPIFGTVRGRDLYGPIRARRATEGTLRLLMLSWEFPPGNVGGLGRHVHDLGEALAAAGHEVHVLTLADGSAGPGLSREAGMVIHRIARPPERGNFLGWVYRYNLAMIQSSRRLEEIYGDFDLVHGHDWLVGQAGMALQARWGVPLVATIHATERGRNGAIREPIQAAIHAEEWQLCRAADALITVSRAMAEEVTHNFQAQPTVIYNGVKLPAPSAAPPMALPAPYFFYIGRLVMEKGVQFAIQALARVQSPAHLVVAGMGPMADELTALARQLGLSDRVHFVGRVTDAQKDGWLQHAAAGVVPSLYEPFGITALEIMSAGTPVLVGDTGGLAEIVTHGIDGLKVPPGDPGALAAAMEELLRSGVQASALARAGKATAERRFAWPAIAEETLSVYGSALGLRSGVRT